MPGFALSASCRAPVEEVWKLLFDPARFPQWWVGIETVRTDAPGAFTQWPTGYPDFPMPQKLRVDRAHERVIISCQVSDIDVVWQLAEAGAGTSIHVTVSLPELVPSGPGERLTPGSVSTFNAAQPYASVQRGCCGGSIRRRPGEGSRRRSGLLGSSGRSS